ncbi:FixH family protein [Enterovirga sp. DB1703]|uniref:FixH family protein n=2 Tax=Enterovirga aerilata TaxID=2730920 RepID=A0A849ID04_9HYPH|nr:FixH family protein [Enterovirga sp. DB1703]
MTSGSDAGFRLTGRKVFLIFLAFFGTIFAADAFLLTSALRTWSGLEVRSPYQAGQRYNAELAGAREQEARGWTMDLDVRRAGDEEADVTAIARDRSGRPITGLAGRASLERPTDKRFDRAAGLVETERGTYRAVIEGALRGQWDLVVDFSDQHGERLFRRRSRVILP